MDLGERVSSEERKPEFFVPEEFPQSVPEPAPASAEASA